MININIIIVVVVGGGGGGGGGGNNNNNRIMNITHTKFGMNCGKHSLDILV
jgi:hypothetical protein